MDNANPIVHSVSQTVRRDLFDEIGDDWVSKVDEGSNTGSEDDADEPITSEEVFGATISQMSSCDPESRRTDLIRSIHDPEHPLSLEQLAVVSPEQITVTHGPRPSITVDFTPTISHCSLASIIGLSLRVRLLRALPERFKVDIRVKKGTHESENALNKQLNDKERVAAALENSHLVEVISQALIHAELRGRPVEA